MINDIINAVCKAVYDEFGTDYRVYAEKVVQGFTQPCFSVSAEYSRNEIFLGRRHKSTNVISVNFYGGEENKREILNDIMTRLPSVLEYITVDGDKMAGTGITSEKGEDCCTCRVNYDYFYYTDGEEDDTELMEVLKIR